MTINQISGWIATAALLLGAVYLVQTLLKRPGASRRLLWAAAFFVAFSSVAYLTTSPEERARLKAKQDATHQTR